MTSPARRPPMVLRALAAVCCVGAVLFNVLLMFSDRAPGALRRIGGDTVRRLFERIDVGDRANEVLTDPRLPESDAIVHVAVWAMAVLLVGWAVWSWVGLAVGAVVVLAGSLAVEALQGRLSDSRSVEASDVAANITGVALGAVTVAACYVTYSALAGLFVRRTAAG